VLRELKRVIRKDGVVWWNVGDTYMTRAHVRARSRERLDALEGRRKKESWKEYPVKRYSAGHSYLKDKDLTLIPFQIALAAQHQGWWVRSVITWSKDNTVPESVKDRPTTSHEYVLMLTQTRFYYYNNVDAKEATISNGWAPPQVDADQRNLRTVWSFGTSGGPNGHVAAFPLELPTRCIAASSRAGDLVIDPFAGSATSLIAARRLGRKYAGCDLALEYVETGNQALLAEDMGSLKEPGKNGRAYMPRLLESREAAYASTAIDSSPRTADPPYHI
jgi:DNA modification methylase